MPNPALIALALALALPGALAKETPKSPKAAPTPVPAPARKILNDSWYVMKAGNSPWGVFHEKIELRDGRYSYRYEMEKREKDKTYQENIGALAEEDLTPVAFNLNKAGEGATEMVNASYSKDKISGYLNIEVKGARVAKLKRHLPPKAILEVFFPVWLSKHWEELKPGKTGHVQVFTEDAPAQDFIAKPAYYEVKGMDDAGGCLEIGVELAGVKSDWCLTAEGALVRMEIPRRQVSVRKVADEKAAKAFLGK